MPKAVEQDRRNPVGISHKASIPSVSRFQNRNLQPYQEVRPFRFELIRVLNNLVWQCRSSGYRSMRRVICPVSRSMLNKFARFFSIKAEDRAPIMLIPSWMDRIQTATIALVTCQLTNFSSCLRIRKILPLSRPDASFRAKRPSPSILGRERFACRLNYVAMVCFIRLHYHTQAAADCPAHKLHAGLVASASST